MLWFKLSAAPVISQGDPVHSALALQDQRVQALFNDRPRKVLSWHSPAHAFTQRLRKDLEYTLEPALSSPALILAMSPQVSLRDPQLIAVNSNNGS
jgi:hypothetical protein